MSVSKLQSALAWAERGFSVFPLVENAKEPIVAAFGSVATTDAATIRAWWTDPVTGMHRDYNIGVLTTDLVVADVDVKKGKPGLDTFRALGGHFETLTVQTPTGGYHCYYYGPNSSLAPLGPGLDVRSNNGYVVGPGSTIDGVPYSIVVDKDMCWVPLEMEGQLRPPGRRADRDGELVDVDTPTAIDNAVAWLKYDAPLACEGQSGDAVTYQAACKLVRDYALTEETAFHLMSQHWNDRCSPPWGADELWRKVENAYQYGTGDLGAARPELAFGGVVVPEVPEPAPLVPEGGFGNALNMVDVPVRPWLVNRLLMRRAVTLLPAAGSSGKSVLSLTIAAHVALGKDFGQYKCKAPCKVVMYNAEDDLQEQSRRLYAICQEYRLPYEEVRSRIMLLTSDDFMLCIAHTTQRQPVMYEPHVTGLLDILRAPDVGLCVLDPLVEIHSCDEQDNGHMRFVMAVLRKIAREGDVSLLVPHHISKGGAGAQPRAGNADVSRGAGAIVNSARVVLTLFAASDADREAFGISEEDKHLFVRLDDAKMNLSLASSQSTWFKKRSARIINGDEVGVFMLHDMQASERAHRHDVAEYIATEMVCRGVGYVSVKDATQIVQDADPLYAKLGPQAARNKIEKLLRSGVELDTGGTVAFIREVDDKGVEKVLVTYG